MAAERARVHHRTTFLVLCVATVGYALLQSLVVPVLPTLEAGLHTSQNNVTWVLTAYLLSASIFTPIVGRLGDMWGKDRLMIVAVLGLVIGCVMSAVATSLPLMVAGRVVQGVGGGVLPLAFGIIRDEHPSDKVAGAVGTLAAVLAAGAGLGLVLAGPIVSALDYHWLFWFPAIMFVLAAIASKFVVPPSPTRTPGRVNLWAASLLSAWLVAGLIAVSEAPVWGWGSARVIGLLVASVALAVLWVVVEVRSSSPLVDMRMMRLPVVWTVNLVAFLFGVGMYAVMGFLPEFLQTSPSAGYGFGLTVTHSGLLILPLSVLMFVVGLWTGRLTVRFGGKKVMLSGSLISIVPFVMLVVAHAHQWEILLATGLMGAGFGLAFSAMSALIVEGVSPEQTGVASGMNANIRTIGGSIGAAVMSSVVTASVRPDGLPTVSGYNHGFGLLTLAAIGAAAAGLLVPTARRTLSKEEFDAALPHAELGLVAAGTLVGDDPE